MNFLLVVQSVFHIEYVYLSQSRKFKFLKRKFYFYYTVIDGRATPAPSDYRTYQDVTV